MEDRCQKKAIQISKYISEAQRHWLLKGRKYDTSPGRCSERTFSIARFIEKHRNTKNIESYEWKEPYFSADTDVVTMRMFGQPVIQSVAKMLLEHYKQQCGADLEFVELSEIVCQMPPAKHDAWQCAKFHVIFKAKPKNDAIGDSEKSFSAEVVAFKSRCAALICNVVACSELENKACTMDYGSSSFETRQAVSLFNILACDKIQQTRPHAWLNREIRPPDSIPMNSLEIRHTAILYFRNEIPAATEEGRRGGSSDAEATQKYLYKYWNRCTDMSMDIPVPKTIGLLDERSQGPSLDQRQELAIAMAKCIEQFNNPRPILSPLMLTLVSELPKCYRKKNYDGGELEAVNSFVINEKEFPDSKCTPARKAALLHMNFKAKLKNDTDVSENLYFAEVVQIYRPFQKPEYNLNGCVPITEKDDPTGEPCKCGICKDGRQIWHPKDGFHVDVSELVMSEYPGWEEAGNNMEEMLERVGCSACRGYFKHIRSSKN